MLSSFTWTQYLVFIASLTALYYVWVFMRYYYHDLESQLMSRLPLKNRTKTDSSPGQIPNVLGKINTPEELSLSDGADLEFADADDKGPKSQSGCPASYLLGTVPDFLKEMKILFQALRESQGDQAMFVLLFKALKTKYPEVAASNQRSIIDVQILEMAAAVSGLELTQSKLDELWANEQ